MKMVYKRTSLLVSLGFAMTLLWMMVSLFSFAPALSVPSLDANPLDEDTAQHVQITYLGNMAQSSGAVCLDGSVPAYHLQQGDPSSWHISFEGGGWCQSLEACANRAQSFFGSSKYMKPFVKFDGLLSSSVQVNPEFYNWTHVLVRYCDGASFSANVSDTLAAPSGKVLYFRGKRIFEAVIKELKLYRGLSDANQVLLSGCSAGGLAAIHRCNDMASFLDHGVKLKCLSDGGFFVNASDIQGSNSILKFYTNIVSFHKLHETLDKSCVSDSSNNGTECYFPQVMKDYVKPPLFILNAAYDFWQLEHVKKLSREIYKPCIMSNSSCPPIRILQQLRMSMIDALRVGSLSNRESLSVFIDSCFTHCHTRSDDQWNIPKINSKSPAQAVGDWYFQRNGEPGQQAIDCAYPCNPTCVSIFD